MAVSDCIRTCRNCGCGFKRTRKGEPTQFCGHECRIEYRKKYDQQRQAVRMASAQPCRIDGCEKPEAGQGYCAAHYARLRKYGDPQGKATPKRMSKPCEWCGNAMLLRPCKAKTRRTCSRSCGSLLTASECGKKILQRGLYCAGCGCWSGRPVRQSGRDTGKYCSPDCYNERKKLIAAERQSLKAIADNWKAKPNPVVACEVAALRRIALYVEKPRLTRRPCKCCGVPTIGVMEHKRTCAGCKRANRQAYQRIARKSPAGRARKKRDKTLRRMRQMQAAECIDPIKVFERDKWRCHLCRQKTLKAKRGSCDPRAPELDHIVSLADGGTHTWGNVACACRKCNGDKGARSMGQLGLGIAA